MGFARAALVQGNVWFGKRKHERVKDEEPLIPEWPCGHRWYEAAAMLRYSGKRYHWHFEMYPIPRDLVPCMLKGMQIDK